MEEDGKIHLILWEVRQLECRILMERDVKNGETCIYFVCYFNGRIQVSCVVWLFY